MKLLIALSFLFLPTTYSFAEPVTGADLKMVADFLGVAAESPSCGANGASCRTYMDCCRGYCDHNHRCNDGSGEPDEDVFFCSPSGGACSVNMDCCGGWCKVERVCF